jgi:hypothetical protein
MPGLYAERDFTPCKRCHGEGYFPEYNRIARDLL